MCEFHEHKSPQTLGSRKGEPQQLGARLKLDHQPPSNPVCAPEGISALKGWLGSMCEFHEHKSPQTLGSRKGEPQQLGARCRSTTSHPLTPSNPVQPRPRPEGNQRALKGWLGSMCEFHEHKSPQTLGSRKGEPQQLGARCRSTTSHPGAGLCRRPNIAFRTLDASDPFDSR